MILNIIKLYQKLSRTSKTIIFATITIIPIYLSGFVSVSINNAMNDDQYKYWIHLIVLFIVLIIFISIYKVVEYGYECILLEKEKKREVILYANSLLQRHLTESQEVILNKPDFNLNNENLAKHHYRNIHSLIEKLYIVFEAQYGKSEEIENRINFEVTFMTKSYIDNEITIPSYANRDKRAPISLSLRSQNSGIYSNTVTALIYHETKPDIHIIENTSNPSSNYTELYAKQLDRIKSSIVFPVLSPQNKLLATIVVHCDKSYFFKYNDLKFWNELLEIFSKFVGLEKIILDSLNEKLF